MPKSSHAAVRRVLRQAWELDDAEKAEKLIRNLARRLEHDAPGVSASILEGLDEILTVTRLGLPKEIRRALACTNIVENVMSTVRRVCRNVKRWRIPPFDHFGRRAVERNPPLFKAESANLTVSASKDGKLRVVYAGWDDARSSQEGLRPDPARRPQPDRQAQRYL